MNIGYVHISTQNQDTVLQQDTLQDVGCEKIYTDTCSGSVPAADRTTLYRLLYPDGSPHQEAGEALRGRRIPLTM